MQIILQLTRACNLGCTYCYQRHRPGAGMTADVAERAVLCAIRDGHQRIALTYFGGEPLLERQMIEESWPALRHLGARAGAFVTAKISTNGVLLDRTFAAFAKRTGLFISLSVDGGPDAQNLGRPTVDHRPTSAAADRAIRALVDEGTPFSTYSVITPENVEFLDRSIEHLFERGARMMVTTLDFGAAWDDPALDRLSRAYKRLTRLYVKLLRSGHSFFLAPFDSKIQSRTKTGFSDRDSCRAGVRQIAVDPEGRIYPCIEFLESEANAIGDVDSGIDRARHRELNRRLAGQAPEACGECAISERCASQCACLNLRTNGAMRAVDALLCAHERILTLTTDRLAAHLMRKRNVAFLNRHFNPYHDALQIIDDVVQEMKP